MNNLDQSAARVGIQHSTPTPIMFRVLTEAQCQQLYAATLECLERVGVLIHHPEARALLQQAGARLEGDRAYIPARIIQRAVDSTPGSFKLYGRDGNHTLEVKPGNVYFGPGPTCTYFNDPQTGEHRHARRGDAAMTARVCDALDNLDYIMSLCLLNDVTPVLSPVYEFAEMITNSGKPVCAWATNPETLADIYAIAARVAGSEAALQERPNFALFATYESPLKHAPNSLGNLLWAAETRAAHDFTGRADCWAGIAHDRRQRIGALPGCRPERGGGRAAQTPRNAHGDRRASIGDGSAHCPPGVWLA